MVLTAKNIFSGYGDKNIIHGISLEIKTGEVLCLLGSNGSGKTTLFKSLLRLLPITAGHIFMDGTDLLSLSMSDFAKQVSYVAQSHEPAFSYTVFDMVMMGRSSHIKPFSTPSKKDEAIVSDTLDRLGIFHLKNREYTGISGGERRLVLIARALCQEAKIIIMDEPCAELDFSNRIIVANTILSLKKDGLGIIISTHSPEFPFLVGDRAMLIRDGQKIAEGKTEDTITSVNLKKTFDVDMQVIEVTDANGKKRRICLTL